LRRAVIVALAGMLGACSRGPGNAPVQPSPTALPPGVVDVDSPRPLPSPIPAIVAKVNGEPVYSGGVHSLARNALAGAPDAGARRPRVYRQALNQMIIRELLFQESQRRKITVSSKEIDAAYDGYRLKYRDEAAWKKMLGEVGMDEDSFRADLRVQHFVDALVRSEAEKAAASITEAELRSAFDSIPVANEAAGSRPNFDEMKPQIQERLVRQRAQEALQALVNSLRAKAKIETYL
jgi:hypothetical protein